MREEYDIVEDIRIKKQNSIFNKRSLKVVAGIAAFLMFLALSFSTAYIYARERIEKEVAEEQAEKAKVSGQASEAKKIYELEKKMLEMIKEQETTSTNQ
jgi:hypothetical protein